MIGGYILKMKKSTTFYGPQCPPEIDINTTQVWERVHMSRQKLTLKDLNLLVNK